MATVTNIDTAHVSTRLASTGNQPAHVVSIASFLAAAAGAYGAGDVISDSVGTAAALVFPDCAKSSGGSGSILWAQVGIEDSDTPNLELWVFDEEPTNFVDNAALALVTGDIPNLVTVFTWGGTNAATASSGANVWYRPSAAAENGEFPYVCEPTTRNLYGLLVTRSAVTLTASDKVHIRLKLELD